MFKDEHRYDIWEQIRQQDLRAFARLGWASGIARLLEIW